MTFAKYDEVTDILFTSGWLVLVFIAVGIPRCLKKYVPKTDFGMWAIGLALVVTAVSIVREIVIDTSRMMFPDLAKFIIWPITVVVWYLAVRSFIENVKRNASSIYRGASKD